jgi:hypothetical protein
MDMSQHYYSEDGVEDPEPSFSQKVDAEQYCGDLSPSAEEP